MYPTLFIRPGDDACVTRPRRIDDHTHCHHDHAHGHHVDTHHHHMGTHNTHHHGGGHHIHHHPHIAATGHGAPTGVVGTPGHSAPARNVMGPAICLGMFGIFFLVSGTMMMSFGYSNFIRVGVVGTLFFIVGLAMLVACGVFCQRGRLQLQQATLVNQQTGGATTLMYDQPGAQPIIYPQPSGATMAYGQPGVQPTVQPPSTGAAITYGPGGGGTYQPQAQPGFQPQPQQNQPMVPFSSQAPAALALESVPSAEPAIVPPPSYDEAVNPVSYSNNGKDESQV